MAVFFVCVLLLGTSVTDNSIVNSVGEASSTPVAPEDIASGSGSKSKASPFSLFIKENNYDGSSRGKYVEFRQRWNNDEPLRQVFKKQTIFLLFLG
jgi:hypothetical protein